MDQNNIVHCPCQNCQNDFLKPLDVVEDHLYKPGISFRYKRWVFHGENYQSSSYYESGSSNRSNELEMETNFVEDTNIDNVEENDEMYDILHDNMVHKYMLNNLT